MVRRNEIEIIKRRALRMLESTKYHLSKGDYDLASFMAEQATQLFIKYKILDKTSEMPRTHVVRRLLSILKEIQEEK
ncbi:MAG: DNA-binding protein [Thermoprotei archaeon]|nr:MAG: DNA-binding protein [Thermoprotei archaeon]RLF17309.1 MAG: DNA-binding protein [Thermoprotei archaeon]